MDIKIFDNKIYEDVFVFFEHLIKHIINVYKNSPVHNETDYVPYHEGEIITQHFPSFPIIRYKAKYTIDDSQEDSWDDKCSKIFPEHWKFSPGPKL